MIPEPARSQLLAALDESVRRLHGKPASEPIPDEELAAARAELEATKPEAS